MGSDVDPASAGRKPNRLIHEKSPYLLQHAYNPVDWHPWGEAAFSKAREEDKPIFLSIGYSTCHWCHVMERESFEDPDVAALMNEAFVSIKVDREERPDVDHLYMTVCQMMTGSGGWPLNIIMSAEKKPFFAGTYFPRETRQGRIGMMDLAPRVKDLWATKREEVLESANKVVMALRQLPDDSPGEAPGPELLDKAYQELTERYDRVHGGFSQAPKFPSPHNMLFLLRYGARTGQGNALPMVEHTLQAMRRGGVYDHVGFGFHRYSTDDQWFVPHFEKMLYDQALLAMTYLEAFQAAGKPEYARTAEEIFTYVLRDMTSPEGGFFSAEDADSEGEEGKFYVWNVEEIERVLGGEDARLARSVFDLRMGGNFEEEATGRLTGNNILHLADSLPNLAERVGLPLRELEDRLEQVRQRLFEVREARVHPHKDDKILTDWNGLMIAAFARGAQVLDRKDYADAAKRAADFILSTLRTPEGHLLHRYRTGEAGLPAHADDYAFFIWGLLELYGATFEVRYLRAALDLNAVFIEHFWDHGVGGFHFSSAGGEDLILRRKEIYDGATPSANSVAALNLLRLARITGDGSPERKAGLIGTAFSGTLRQFPSAYTQMLMALEFGVGPGREVVVAGRPDDDDTRVLLRELRKPFLPNMTVVLRPADEDRPDIAELAPYTERQRALDGRATAYVCVNYNCELPTTDPQHMMELVARR